METRINVVKNWAATAEGVAQYLPRDYRVTGEDADTIYVAGHDRAGWTAHDYVIPRLASGLITATIVDDA